MEEGGRCFGVGVVVASVCPFSGQTHHTSIPIVVVSLMIHDHMYIFFLPTLCRINVHIALSVDTFTCIYTYVYMCMYMYIDMWIY